MNLRNFATHWTTTTLHEELSKLKSRLPNAPKIIKGPDDKLIEEKPFEEEIITFQRHFLRWAIPGHFLYFHLFFQLYNFSNTWISTSDLWCRMQPLYQLSHNHCPFFGFAVSSPGYQAKIARWT